MGSERKLGEADLIVAAAREVGQRLGIPSSDFQRVMAIKYFPSDVCGFRGNTIFLRRSMLGKLDPVEWKPLLASYLIHKKTRRQGLLPTALLEAAEWLVLLFAGVVLIARVLGQNGASLALVHVLVMSPVFLINRSTQDTKKRKLKADTEAAKIIDRAQFLQTLEKIDSLKLKDVERAKKSKVLSHFTTRPSILARISNLREAKDLGSSGW